MNSNGQGTMELNIGINTEDRQEIAAGLSKLLADSYSLYLKTHNYHWNVTGPQFNTLHTMFEGQYAPDTLGKAHTQQVRWSAFGCEAR